jgi:O-methyltransferase involved in polyketide biosynthesis
LRCAIRARFFQECVREAVWKQDIKQIVLVNCSFDSLPWRLQLQDDTHVFCAFLTDRTIRYTNRFFNEVPSHCNKTQFEIGYADPSTWLEKLKDVGGLNTEEKTCLIAYNLPRIYDREEVQKFYSDLNILPSGSMVVHEYMGETLWGHDARDLDPIKGTLAPFQFLLDDPSEMFDQSHWDTTKETIDSLNYDGRAVLHPQGVQNFVFGVSTRK